MRRSDDEQTAPGSGEGVFDWDQFQNSFFGGAGWKEMMSSGGAGSIPWVDKYLKGILADTVPGAAAHPPGPSAPLTSKMSSITCNVFETHRALIVRVRLTADADPRMIRLFASPGEIRVAGLPGGDDKIVKLPMLVHLDGAKAVYKQRIIEITLQKDEQAPVKEIPIRYMEGG